MKTYSQSGQDIFAWEMCGQKSQGTFIDIGCNDPFIHNNTVLLEMAGWRGVSVDIEWFDYSKRAEKMIQANAKHRISEVERFIKCHGGKVDYLSLDADDATFEAMSWIIPLCQFKVITVEHDRYRIGPKVQNDIFEFLTKAGYSRKFQDVLAPKCEGMPWSEQPYEDWYIRP